MAFAVSAGLQPAVAAAGFALFPVGGNAAADPEYQQVKAQLATMPLDLASEVFAYPRLFCGIGARRADAATGRHRPELAARSVHSGGGEYGAVIAAEHLGLPHVTVAFAAALKGMAIFERTPPRSSTPFAGSGACRPTRP